jgi:hypothetical protein
MFRAELRRPKLREGELPMFSALFDPEMLTILLVAVISGGTFYFVMYRQMSLSEGMANDKCHSQPFAHGTPHAH